jgi:hypothetical protein
MDWDLDGMGGLKDFGAIMGFGFFSSPNGISVDVSNVLSWTCFILLRLQMYLFAALCSIAPQRGWDIDLINPVHAFEGSVYLFHVSFSILVLFSCK